MPHQLHIITSGVRAAYRAAIKGTSATIPTSISTFQEGALCRCFSSNSNSFTGPFPRYFTANPNPSSTPSPTPNPSRTLPTPNPSKTLPLPLHGPRLSREPAQSAAVTHSKPKPELAKKELDLVRVRDVIVIGTEKTKWQAALMPRCPWM